MAAGVHWSRKHQLWRSFPVTMTFNLNNHQLYIFHLIIVINLHSVNKTYLFHVVPRSSDNGSEMSQHVLFAGHRWINGLPLELSTRQETLTQCQFDVGPASRTVGHRQPSIGSTSRVYWVML